MATAVSWRWSTKKCFYLLVTADRLYNMNYLRQGGRGEGTDRAKCFLSCLCTCYCLETANKKAEAAPKELGTRDIQPPR